MIKLFQSRFFLESDPIMRDFSWKGKSFHLYDNGWWSRIYEYQWMYDVSKEYFADNISSKSAIDVATGNVHPGMFILKSAGFKTVVGVDLFLQDKLHNADILSEDIRYMQEDILAPKINTKFDCVSCISLIEHIHPQNQEEAIRNILSYVAAKGCVIFTFDFPGYDYAANIPMYESILKGCGFTFQKEEVDKNQIMKATTSSIASNFVKSKNLSCYRIFSYRE